MKRLLFNTLMCITLFSCKKNYTCYCGDWNSSNKTAVFSVKDTKKKAQKKCDDYRNDMIAIPEYTCRVE